MTKQTKTVPVVADDRPATKTTDRVYANLQPYEEIIVQVGPRQRVQNNKVVTVEEARNVIFTKAGYEAMDRTEEGETIHTLTQVLGIPEYKTVRDPTALGGFRTEFDVLHFPEIDGVTEPEA